MIGRKSKEEGCKLQIACMVPAVSGQPQPRTPFSSSYVPLDGFGHRLLISFTDAPVSAPKMGVVLVLYSVDRIDAK